MPGTNRLIAHCKVNIIAATRHVRCMKAAADCDALRNLLTCSTRARHLPASDAPATSAESLALEQACWLVAGHLAIRSVRPETLIVSLI